MNLTLLEGCAIRQGLGRERIARFVVTPPQHETGFDSVIPEEHFSQDSARHSMMQDGIRVHNGGIRTLVWVADDVARTRIKCRRCNSRA